MFIKIDGRVINTDHVVEARPPSVPPSVEHEGKEEYLIYLHRMTGPITVRGAHARMARAFFEGLATYDLDSEQPHMARRGP